MFKRMIEPQLQDLAAKYPIVTVTGPRQSGKTTLVRAVFNKKPYVNLEDPDIRHLVEEDPRGFLAKYPQGAILDELQRVPIFRLWWMKKMSKVFLFLREVIS